MSTLAWTRFRYLTRPARLLRLIIEDVAKFIENKRARWSPYATLERCADKLEHLRLLIRAISPQRRRKIQTAAERGVCKHIIDVEAVLEECVPLLFHVISPLCLSTYHPDTTRTTTGCVSSIESSRFTCDICQAQDCTSTC